MRARSSISLFASLAGLLVGCPSNSPEPPPATPQVAARSLAVMLAQEAAEDVQRAEPPTLVVPHGDAPTVDGDLSDWPFDAGLTGAFVRPGDGQAAGPSPVRSSAALRYDQSALYVALYVADTDAESPNERDAVDPHIWATASGIELMLQPGDHGDNASYFEVQVDVNEAVWDTRFDDYNRPITGDGAARQYGHQGWDAQLERSVRTGPHGYIVEFALPWSALHEPRAAVPPAPGDVWRANLYSFRDGQRHALAWSPIMGAGNFHRSSRFGRLEFGAP